jgi:hypothetical protein
VAGIKSESWPASRRNTWPECVGIFNHGNQDDFSWQKPRWVESSAGPKYRRKYAPALWAAIPLGRYVGERQKRTEFSGFGPEGDIVREHFGPRGEKKDSPNKLPLEANTRRDCLIGW